MKSFESCHLGLVLCELREFGGDFGGGRAVEAGGWLAGGEAPLSVFWQGHYCV